MTGYKATFWTARNSTFADLNLLGEFETDDSANAFVTEFIAHEYQHFEPDLYHWTRNGNMWSNGFDVITVSK